MIVAGTLVLLLLGTIYATLLWEIRRLRAVVHWHQNQITWCRATLSLWSQIDGRLLPLPAEPIPPPDFSLKRDDK